MRAAAPLLPNVVDRQAGQAAAAESVGAGVADMQQMRDAAAQHERRKGAAEAGDLGILPAHRVDPAIERADDPRAGPLYLHRLRQIAETVEKTAYRGLRGDAAAFRAADAVGDRGNDLLARLGQFSADQRPGEILVGLAGPGFR